MNMVGTQTFALCILVISCGFSVLSNATKENEVNEDKNDLVLDFDHTINESE